MAGVSAEVVRLYGIIRDLLDEIENDELRMDIYIALATFVHACGELHTLPGEVDAPPNVPPSSTRSLLRGYTD